MAKLFVCNLSPSPQICTISEFSFIKNAPIDDKGYKKKNQVLTSFRMFPQLFHLPDVVILSYQTGNAELELLAKNDYLCLLLHLLLFCYHIGDQQPVFSSSREQMQYDAQLTWLKVMAWL